MEPDIHELLCEVSTNVQNVGRKLGSTKIDVFDLAVLHESLLLSANTVQRCMDMLKTRAMEL